MVSLDFLVSGEFRVDPCVVVEEEEEEEVWLRREQKVHWGFAVMVDVGNAPWAGDFAEDGLKASSRVVISLPCRYTLDVMAKVNVDELKTVN